MHDEGKSLREIARATGASHQTIANWIEGRYLAREDQARYSTRPHRALAILSPAGQVAQLAEHRSEEPGVDSSILSLATPKSSDPKLGRADEDPASVPAFALRRI
jgi:hypothetical protein